LGKKALSYKKCVRKMLMTLNKGERGEMEENSQPKGYQAKNGTSSLIKEKDSFSGVVHK
jgi:hypothetical protein